MLNLTKINGVLVGSDMTFIGSDLTGRDLTMERTDGNSLNSLGNGKSLMILIVGF